MAYVSQWFKSQLKAAENVHAATGRVCTLIPYRKATSAVKLVFRDRQNGKFLSVSLSYAELQEIAEFARTIVPTTE